MGRRSNNDTMPKPIVTQPKPARKPASAPHAVVVLGSFRNMARFNDITRLRTQVMPKTLPMFAAGGSLVNPLARFHALPKSKLYQIPPIGKAEMAATRMAQGFSVCTFIRSGSFYLLFGGSGLAGSPHSFSQSMGPLTKRR